MLNRIVRFSLQNRVPVIAVAVVLIVMGVYTTLMMPVDVLPDLTRPRVTIFLESEGMAAEEVEQYVVYPVESAVNGAPNVITTRSNSAAGYGIVFVEFEYGTEIYKARQIVSEKLQTVETLPKDITPKLGPVVSVTGQIMTIGLQSDEISIDSLRLLADYTISRRLKAVPGVSEVLPTGGGVLQVHVNLSMLKMRGLDVSISDIETALESSNKNTTGGYIHRSGKTILIRNLGRIRNKDELEDLVITYRNGEPILLSQVVESIEFDAKQKIGDASMNGKPAVLLVIEKQPGSGTLDVTAGVEEALEELKPSLPKGTIVNSEIFRQADFIDNSIGNVKEALELGALFVIIVLFFFLMNVRATFITLLSIPISLLVSAIIFDLMGVTVNTMTLGGLAIAIGELVDDSIVDVENIYSRLRKNPKGNRLKITYKASLEVRNTIIYSTIIVILIFSPMFAMDGMEGRIFMPLGIAYIVSILVSTLVSMTVTPVLSSYLLVPPKNKEIRDTWVVRKLKSLDASILKYTLHNTRIILIAALVLLFSSLAIIPYTGSEFLPGFNEGSLTVGLSLPQGSSIEESNEIGMMVEKELLEIPEVRFTGRRIGRAELDEHIDPPHMADIEVALKENGRSKPEIVADIRQRISKFKGVNANIGQPLSHKLEHLESGVSATVAIKVYGHDLMKLRQYAHQIKGILEKTEGAVDVNVQQQQLSKQLIIRPREDDLKRYGVTSGKVTEDVEKVLKGKTITHLRSEEKRIAVVMRMPDEKRENLDEIGQIAIETQLSGLVPLSELADIYFKKGPTTISHQNTQRNIIVSCNVADRDVGSTVKEIKESIKDQVDFDNGYFVTYEGKFENRDSAARNMLLLGLLAFVGTLILLYNKYRSWWLVLQILMSIPFALIGGLVAIMLTDGTISLSSLIGFIALAGIASRNGLLLIGRYITMMDEENQEFNDSMIVLGSQERLVPVLMTAFTAILALIPLLFDPLAPGKELLYPLAVVMVGGLITSTVLEIIVTPVVFKMIGKKAVKQFLNHKQNKSTLLDESQNDN